MHDHDLDRLFDRFRRRGDVPALGTIFDATAPELLHVAMSLVSDPGAADDLLQETFLTAIERAERYDAERRLVPWLLGILVHHAKERRRLQRRVPDPERLAAREVQAPEVHALGRELEQELDRALAELSAREQAVLDAYLRQGKGAAEIASEIGAAPGAVRMQIHRGLDRLRKALPAGLALGAAGGALGAQGLATVREAILRAGETAAKSLAPGAGSALGGGTAGLLLGKKLLLAGVVAAAAAGLWFLVERRERPGETGVEVARAAAPAATRSEVATSPPAARADAAAPVAEPASAPASRDEVAAGSDPDLAGLRGRLVTSDGRPAPGLGVALLELDEAAVLPALTTAIDAPPFPRLRVAEAVSAPDGSFVLAGASPRAVHALGVDLGGPRATVRVLDAKLSPGETADLGEVVLAATGSLRGTVVDPDGHPVAGARVRVGAIPELGITVGLHYLGAGGALTMLEGSGAPLSVFELPSWFAEVEELLPLATVSTDAEGRFALEPAAGSGLIALVDAPGFARFATLPFELGREKDLGPLVLDAGASVRGRVVEPDGRPVAHAELRAGTLAELMRVTVLGPLQRSDEEGRFVLEHLPRDFSPAVIARRDPLGPWAGSREKDGEFVIELAPARELVVEVLDAAGAAVPVPELFLRPDDEKEQELGTLTPLRAVVPRPLEGASGRWRVGPLARGSYFVAARAAGLAQTLGRVTIDEREPPVLTLRLAALRLTEVLVREAGSGAPLPRALVRIEEGGTSLHGLERTDARGRALLPVPDGAARDLRVHVQHPRFAPVERVLEPSAPVVVELSAGARVVARLADPGLAPEGGLLVLTHHGAETAEENHLPLLCAVPREEPVALEHLAPGRWSWIMVESLAGQDAFAFLDPQRSPARLARGEFTLAEGATHELALERPPVERPKVPDASLSGVVRIAGGGYGELSLKLVPLTRNGTKTQAVRSRDGSFRLEGMLPGRYYLNVDGLAPESGTIVTLAQDVVELAAGEAKTIEVEVETVPLRLRVETEDGRAVKGAKVRLLLGELVGLGVEAQVRTALDGSATLALAYPGRYEVSVEHAAEGLARAEIEVTPGEASELVLTLSRGVECSGTVVLDPAASFAGEQAMLVATSEGEDRRSASCSVRLAEAAPAFRLVGLLPGRYRATLLGEGGMLRGETFELPRTGSAALELRFSGARILPAPR